MTPQQGGSASTWDRYAYHILSASALGVVLGATVVYRIHEDWSWVWFYIVVGLSIIATFLSERLRRHSIVLRQVDRGAGE